MYEKHITKDNIELMICEMEDSHLKNTIYFFLKKIKNIIFIGESRREISKYHQELYGYKNICPEEAAKVVKITSARLSYYILEATLRNIVDEQMIKEIVSTFARKEKYIKTYGNLLLENNIDNEDDWLNEDYNE